MQDLNTIYTHLYHMDVLSHLREHQLRWASEIKHTHIQAVYGRSVWIYSRRWCTVAESHLSKWIRARAGALGRIWMCTSDKTHSLTPHTPASVSVTSSQQLSVFTGQCAWRPGTSTMKPTAFYSSKSIASFICSSLMIQKISHLSDINWWLCGCEKSNLIEKWYQVKDHLTCRN